MDHLRNVSVFFFLSDNSETQCQFIVLLTFFHYFETRIALGHSERGILTESSAVTLGKLPPR